MNSEVIKVVAGGGKTTKSESILRNESNGLYLAFNNSVVNELKLKGYICKTIDSLFTSYIIPKFTSLIPIIGNGSKITYDEIDDTRFDLKGIGNLSIKINGDIYNRNKNTGFNLNMSNDYLHSLNRQPNLNIIKYIFGKKKLRLTHQLRSDLSSYLISNYPNAIVEILANRFTFVIFDEAQDLHGYLEQFAILIHNSKIKSFFLGDDFQSINYKANWFKNLTPTEMMEKSHRCPENNCKWIRENLGITIYGNCNESTFMNIQIEEALSYDNGKRVLIYSSKAGKAKILEAKWTGEKYTVKSAKGMTIDNDIVIVGESMSKKCYYTAITRTTRNVFSTITKIK